MGREKRKHKQDKKEKKKSSKDGASKRQPRYRQMIFVFHCEDVEVDINVEKIRYYIYQQEYGQENRRKHLQGYVQFTEPVTYKQAKAMFNHPDSDTIHWEQAMGSCTHNREYCSKLVNKDGSRARTEEGRVVTWGTPVADGSKKGSILDCVLLLRDGKTMEQVEELFPGVVTLHREKLETTVMQMKMRNLPTFRNVYVEVLWGDPGCGKTHSVYSRWQAHEIYKKSASSGKWWPGYRGQKVLLLDEFYGQMPIDTALGILDGYHMILETKGGFTFAEWEHVVLTSNCEPSRWYPDAKAMQVKAMMDRINVVNHLTGESKRKKTRPYPTIQLREFLDSLYEESNNEPPWDRMEEVEDIPDIVPVGVVTEDDAIEETCSDESGESMLDGLKKDMSPNDWKLFWSENGMDVEEGEESD